MTFLLIDDLLLTINRGGIKACANRQSSILIKVGLTLKVVRISFFL